MSVKVTIRIKFQPDKKLTEFSNRVGKVSPEKIVRVLKKALQATLLEGIRKRYAAKGFDMQYVYRAGQNNSAKFNSIHAQRRLISLARQIQREQEKAEKSGRRERLNQLLEDQRNVLRDFLSGARPQLKHTGDTKASRARRALDKATQKKKAAMDRVLQKLVGANAFVVTNGSDSVNVGVGVIAQLNQIETPSATPLLTGHPSKSPYKQLWLQMEYGAGIFAKPGPSLHNVSPNKTGVGSWWYGKRAGAGIHFIGQKPGNLLRDHTGLPYSGEYRSFLRMFGDLMNELIFGAPNGG